MNQDRGSIKWTSLMLPEHVVLLKELYEQDQHVQQPEIDEQQVEHIHSIIMEAQREQTPICISYYSKKQVNNVTGFIQSVDSNTQQVILENKLKNKIIIPAKNLIDAQHV
ncbi:YolD-like family protein [Ornithinibacillus gellani]|uniref:YolD-like family protein n=1 Tax=Ornithinibacillus gellani TaxID=2293253 RepID=UPI00168095D4|nr:YolD-like family protein [Ornithinibacillus gellani]